MRRGVLREDAKAMKGQRMTKKKKISVRFTNPEAKAVWDAVLQAKAEVDSWPEWKRGSELDSLHSDKKTLQDLATAAYVVVGDQDRELATLRADLAEAIGVVRDLLDLANEMFPYVAEYFVDKWGIGTAIVELRNRAAALLAKHGGGRPEATAFFPSPINALSPRKIATLMYKKLPDGATNSNP